MRSPDPVSKWNLGRFRTALDVVASVAILAAAVVVIHAVLSQRSTTIDEFKVGDVLPEIDEINFSDPNGTLLLWVQSTCPFCTKGMPYYKELAEDPNRKAQLIVASSELLDVLEQYLEQHKVKPTKVVALTGPDSLLVRLHSTPMALLTDKDRRIVRIWVGLLDAKGQAELTAAAR
jgi:hypothetical protein